MEKYLKGDVVVLPFPYSNLKQHKKRPALVLANLKGEDIILCQITSKMRESSHCVLLEEQNFAVGSLPIPSHIHCSLIFTVDKGLILKKVGTINMGTMVRVLQTFGNIFALQPPL